MKALVLACVILVAYPSMAQADCSTDNPSTCAYVPVGQSANITPGAFTASPSCAVVTNNSCPGDVMVPTSSQQEWSSFLNSTFVTTPGSCITIGGCISYSYAWVASGFGACSLTCGSGTQTQTVSCVQTSSTGSTATVADSYCAGSPMPATSQSCNTQACSGGGGSPSSSMCYVIDTQTLLTIPQCCGNPPIVTGETAAYLINQTTGADQVIASSAELTVNICGGNYNESSAPATCVINGVQTPLCSGSPAINGVCGQSLASCTSGWVTDASGNNWTCSGINGGTSESCQVGTSGNVNIEVSTSKGGNLEITYNEALVASNNCADGENYQITSVTIQGVPSSQWNNPPPAADGYASSPSGGPMYQVWQALGTYIQGMTLQCGTSTSLASASVTEPIGGDAIVMPLKVIKSNGSPGTLTPNSYIEYDGTSWSGP